MTGDHLQTVIDALRSVWPQADGTSLATAADQLLCGQLATLGTSTASLTFGKDNNFSHATISIGTIAGRDNITLNINFSQPINLQSASLHNTKYDVTNLPNPYLGLNSFTDAEAPRFAGRDNEIAHALNLLTASGHMRTVLFITGVSGAGKSSLAMAGIIPVLAKYYQGKQHRQFLFATFRPSKHPLTGLRDALSELGFATSDVSQPSITLDVLLRTTPPTQRNLILIDQFEEIYTHSDPEEAKTLLDLLETLSDVRQTRTQWLITLRADFLGEIFARPVLYDLATSGLPLRMMDEASLRHAIVAPILAFYPDRSKDMDPELVTALVRDASDDASCLPLLQMTLYDIWERGKLTLGAYTTLSAALNERGNALVGLTEENAQVEQDPTDEQKRMVELLLDLVDVSPSKEIVRDVRRQRSLGDLVKEPRDSELINMLAQARLISIDTAPYSNSTILVELSHEALLDPKYGWKGLRKRINEQRRFLQQRARFKQWLEDWIIADVHQRPNLLLTGLWLAEAISLQAANDVELRSVEAQTFLQESIASRDVEQKREIEQAQRIAAAERERAEAQQKRAESETIRALDKTIQARKFAYLSILLGILLFITFVILRYAIIQRDAAQQRLQITNSQQLAFAAQSQIPENPETALLLSYEAAVQHHNILSERVLYQTLGAKSWIPITLDSQSYTITEVLFSQSENVVLTISNDNIIRLWDKKGYLRRIINGYTAAVSSNDGSIFIASGENIIRLSGGDEYLYKNLEDNNSLITAITISSDDRWILTISADFTSRVWDIRDYSYVILDEGMQPIRYASFSPSGEYILTEGSNGAKRLFRSTGEFVRDLDFLLEYSENRVIFSPDSSYFLTDSYSGEPRLWTLDGKELRSFSDNNGSPNMAIFSPDSQYIFTATWEDLGAIWETKTGRRISQIDPGRDSTGLVSAEFSPNGKYLLTHTFGRPVDLWDLSGQRVASYEPTDAIQFSPDGQIVMTISSHGVIKLWDLKGQLLATLQGHIGAITGVLMSPDGSTIITYSDDGTARIWTPKTNTIFKYKSSIFQRPYFSTLENGNTLIVNKNIKEDYYAEIWNIVTHTSITISLPLLERDLERTGFGKIDFNPNSQYFLTISSICCPSNSKADMWDLQGKLIVTFDEDWVNDVRFSPDGLSVLIASGFTTAELKDLNGNKQATLQHHTDEVNKAVFSPDGQYILTGSSDTTAILWNKTGHLIHVFHGHTDVINDVNFSPDGQYILTASSDGTARIWMTSGEVIAEIRDNSDFNDNDVWEAKFSPDGNFILTNSFSSGINVWDLKGNHVATLQENTETAEYAYFIPESQRITTLSNDNKVRIWNTYGQVIAVFDSPVDDFFSSIHFDKSGSSLFAITNKGIIERYRLNFDDLLSLAACSVGRGLTQDEIDKFQIETPYFKYADRHC